MTAAKFAKDMNIETSLVVAILKSRGDVIKGSNTITDEQMDFVKTNLNKQEEKEEIENEKKDIENEIVRLKAILENPIPELTKIFNYIKNTYGDSRRSIITQVAITKEEKDLYNLNDMMYNELYENGGLAFHLKFMYPQTITNRRM